MSKTYWGIWLPWVILVSVSRARPCWWKREHFTRSGNFLRTPRGRLLPLAQKEAHGRRRKKSDSPGIYKGGSCPTTGSKSDDALLTNMPTEARANPGMEMASINLKGWQQGRGPRRQGQERGLLSLL